MKVSIVFDDVNADSIYESVSFDTGSGGWGYAAELFIKSGCCFTSIPQVITEWLEEDVLELEQLERIVNKARDTNG